MDSAHAEGELAVGAVDSAKVPDNTLTAADLATDSVDADEIAANAITASEIAADAVGSSELGETALIPHSFTFLDGSADVTWTNMPSALMEFNSSSRDRTQLDLTKATQARVIVRVQTAGASTPAKLRVQYLTDSITWAYLDASSAPSVNVNATGIYASSWVSLTADAKTDRVIRLAGIDGDGAVDPAFGAVSLRVK